MMSEAIQMKRTFTAGTFHLSHRERSTAEAKLRQAGEGLGPIDRPIPLTPPLSPQGRGSAPTVVLTQQSLSGSST